MPDWLGWLHLPDISDTEFERQKAEYVAQNGYTITIPGLSDIIKIQTTKPMTDEEHYHWTQRDYEFFSPYRLEELRRESQKRRERFLNLLGSPQPQVLRALGSIMTAIDDAQDGISTLAVLGQIARRVAPKALGKLLQGPVGILTAVSDILNLIQAVPQACLTPYSGKRIKDAFSRASPKNLLGRAKNVKKLNNAIPGKGDLIQALQTTESIFGFGISLGPLMGLLVDIPAGAVRYLSGEKVRIKLPTPDWEHWRRVACFVEKSITFLWSFYHETDDDDILLWAVAGELALQHLQGAIDQWNPLDQVEDLEDVQVKALEPWHSQTLEIFRQEGYEVQDHIAWPSTGARWSTIREISDTALPVITQNLSAFQERNKHQWRGFTGASAMAEGGMFTLSLYSGPGNVEYEYTVSSTVASMFMAQQTRLDPNQPIEKFTDFIAYLNYLEKVGHYPTYDEIISFCTGPADIKLKGVTR